MAKALALLAQQPGFGTPYEGARTKSVRRLLVGRIRYFIYYRVTPDALEVLAVWHVSRNKQPALRTHDAEHCGQVRSLRSLGRANSGAPFTLVVRPHG